MEFRQLLPEAGAVDELALLADLGTRPAPAERPYVVVNFVASADGHATAGGRSGPLGQAGDRAMFHAVREQVDAVLAGTNTVRLERYGRLLSRPERRERRRAAGRPAEPLACLVSRRVELPTDLPLLAEPEARVVLFTAAEPVATDGWRAEVEIVRLPEAELTLDQVLGLLRRRFGIRTLLCEGGPSLFAALLEADLVDELFLTLAPKLTGGDGPAVSAGTELAVPARLRIVWLLEHEHELLLRYRVDR